MSTIYSDGVVNVSFIEGSVRLELVRILHLDKDGRAKYEVEQVLVLSLPAFLRFQQQIDSMVEKLVEEGILKKTETTQSLTAGGAGGAKTEIPDIAASRAMDDGTVKTEMNSNWMKFLGAKPAH